jgi:hypothetical protein
MERSNEHNKKTGKGTHCGQTLIPAAYRVFPFFLYPVEET